MLEVKNLIHEKSLLLSQEESKQHLSSSHVISRKESQDAFLPLLSHREPHGVIYNQSKNLGRNNASHRLIPYQASS